MIPPGCPQARETSPADCDPMETPMLIMVSRKKESYEDRLLVPVSRAASRRLRPKGRLAISLALDDRPSRPSDKRNITSVGVPDADAHVFNFSRKKEGFI